jgi:hypothetical protein
VSRRLQNASKNRVESGGFPRTSVETASSGKRRPLNELAPEVARHQSVARTRYFEFDSRRLQTLTSFISTRYSCTESRVPHTCLPWVITAQSALMAGKLHRRSTRFLQTARRGHALVGNVKCHSVIDRRSDDRQLERHIDCALEVDHLHGNVPLVVIHAHDRVITTVQGVMEDDVPWG